MEEDWAMADLQSRVDVIRGKRLEELGLACEMMTFGFEEYALHAQGLTRIIKGNDILATTGDYQSWDGECSRNNDEWYFVEKYREEIVGGKVLSVEVNRIHDVRIELDNGVVIEVFVSNGYCHFGEESEQWRFFEKGKTDLPDMVVYGKSVEMG